MRGSPFHVKEEKMNIMKLDEKYFNFIKYGTKRIELRLIDEKRKLIKVGDKLTFLKRPELNEKIEVTVTELVKSNSFEKIILKYPIEILGDKKMNKKDLLKDLEQFYTKEEQTKYGVLGIIFKI